MSDRDYETIAAMVERLLGIKMSRAKKPMIASRLLRRLRTLRMSSYASYCAHLRTPRGMDSERTHLLDLITTHKTDFFREPQHFEILRNDILSSWTAGRGGEGALRVWSAGCSNGQEVYTLAMVLATALGLARAGSREFSILGTDVSSSCVEKAALAIYTDTEIEGIPGDARNRFLLRSRNSTERKYRIVPELRARAEFRTLNFMDSPWRVEMMDVVFCRNVLIYFSPDVQHTILSRLCQHLRPGGYLFISHSEALPGGALPLTSLGRSVFKKK